MASHFLLVVLVASILHAAYATTSTTSANLAVEATTTAYSVLEKKTTYRVAFSPTAWSHTLSIRKVNLRWPFLGSATSPITFGGQEFKFPFATTVGGVIGSGSIHEVYGVRVQIKFGWLGLRQVDRAGDQLTLQVQQFTVISGQRLFREPILQLRLRLI